MSLRTYAQAQYPAGTGTLFPAAAQAPAANTAAVVTLAANNGVNAASAALAWKVERVRWSYSSTPTAGSLTIAWTDPVLGAAQEVYAITAAGQGEMDLYKIFPGGSAVTFTLAVGGGSVVGTVYVDAECSPA